MVGGDGTLREAAEGLQGASAPVDLGFIPMGNANVIARELGIPLDPLRAAELAADGRAQLFDAVRANGRFVLAMVGVGYDGIVTRWMERARGARLASGWYRRHADSLYVTLGASALFAPHPRFALEVDGVAQEGGYRNLVVSNVGTYAKGWSVIPGADPRDGLLDYQLRRRAFFPYGLTALAGASLKKRIPGFMASYGQARSLRLVGERPFPWQADGDSMGLASELEVEVLPAALRLVGPG